MEKELRLNPDEVVVLRSAGVGYGNSGFGRSHELILTDQAIILIRKGAFGRTKDVLLFPLKDIRVVGGTGNNGEEGLHDPKPGRVF